MPNQTPSSRPPRATAEIIDRSMPENDLTNRRLAVALGTTPGVIAAIRSDRLPVPLAWVPTIAQMISHDKPQLMSMAIDEQRYDILVAIAGALLWQRNNVEQDWIDLVVEFAGGVLPDPQDVPQIVKALREAINDNSSTH